MPNRRLLLVIANVTIVILATFASYMLTEQYSILHQPISAQITAYNLTINSTSSVTKTALGLSGQGPYPSFSEGTRINEPSFFFGITIFNNDSTSYNFTGVNVKQTDFAVNITGLGVSYSNGIVNLGTYYTYGYLLFPPESDLQIDLQIKYTAVSNYTGPLNISLTIDPYSITSAT